jgi:hypothetical protein
MMSAENTFQNLVEEARMLDLLEPRCLERGLAHVYKSWGSEHPWMKTFKDGDADSQA